MESPKSPLLRTLALHLFALKVVRIASDYGV